MKIKYLGPLILFLCSACGVGVQTRKFKALEDCKYSVTSADSITIANVALEEIVDKEGNVHMNRLPSLAFAMLDRNVPLRGTVRLKIDNPSEDEAGINHFEYKILMNNNEVADGIVDQKIEVQPKASQIVPLRLNVNAYQLFKGQNLEKVMQLLSGKGEIKDEDLPLVTIKIKPYIMVGNQIIKYPGYFNIDKKITRDLFL